jgi:glycosyltransferase involved in cell wall biosynthesis
MNPLVSAVIAAYNEEIHLANCINSLLNQSYKKLEIIVVENGNSTDKTFEIAKEFSKKLKRVRAFSIPGKQKGPGNAWNFGIKKAKGSIVMICGADLIYGKDYVKKGIIPILQGKSIGIVHKEEKCNNIKNYWARAFFKSRSTINPNGLSKVFSLVDKNYVAKRPFNSDLGYADDQTIYRTEGTEFIGVDLEVYHTNPASFQDTWEHSLWVGRSLEKPMQVIFLLPFFILYAIYKTIKHLKVDFYFPFIFFLPLYYSIRYFAYFKESLKKIF